jgi:hypothetical protein
MKYEQGNLILDNKEMSALSCATWNDRVESIYDAREFIQNMKLNRAWADSEIRLIEMKEQGKREKIIVETLRIAIQHFELFEQRAKEVTQEAGVSVSLH